MYTTAERKRHQESEAESSPPAKRPSMEDSDLSEQMKSQPSKKSTKLSLAKASHKDAKSKVS